MPLLMNHNDVWSNMNPTMNDEYNIILVERIHSYFETNMVQMISKMHSRMTISEFEKYFLAYLKNNVNNEDGFTKDHWINLYYQRAFVAYAKMLDVDTTINPMKLSEFLVELFKYIMRDQCWLSQMWFVTQLSVSRKLLINQCKNTIFLSMLRQELVRTDKPIVIKGVNTFVPPSYYEPGSRVESVVPQSNRPVSFAPASFGKVNTAPQSVKSVPRAQPEEIPHSSKSMLESPPDVDVASILSPKQGMIIFDQ